MPFIRTWLVPRVAFWVMWTAWLWCLQAFLLDRFSAIPGYPVLFFVLGPPMLITWLGSRFARNPFDTPNALFWKGAAVSCFFGLFTNIFLTKELGGGLEFLVVAFLLCGYIGMRGAAGKRIEVKQGELFDVVHAIARASGVYVKRVVIFASPQNVAAAFSHRMGTILLSDRLLRVLSRPETDTVIAHEVAHLRPYQQTVVRVLPILAVSTVVISFVWPGAKASAPFWPFAGILLWRAIRRVMEFDADANAIRITNNPEALITALARISMLGGLPMHWGRFAGFFMAHPPMTARFRALARRARISQARVDELVSASGTVPPLPGYASPFGPAEPAPPAGDILSLHNERLKKQMTLLSGGFPLLAGVALAGVMSYWPLDLPLLLLLTAVWIIGGMLLFWVIYEVLVGSARQRLRSQLPDGHEAGSYFVGLSTAAEPRYFDGSYHYDLGLANFSGGNLNFRGTRCSFSLKRSQVRRVWLANGPRHWTPRKMVCVEYQFDDQGPLAVVSMQPLERWFWPGTSQAAKQLLTALEQWCESAALPDSPPVPPPQVIGPVVPTVSPKHIWKSLRLPCLISMGVGFVIGSLSPSLFGGFLGLVCAPLVTGALVLFVLAPHLE